MYVVEVSNPRLANDSAYERWKTLSFNRLAERIESETGWSLAESEEAALAVVRGESFEDVDEDGRTVTARTRTRRSARPEVTA